MPVRGDITIECDAAYCHAEIIVDAERLWPHGYIRQMVEAEEWKVQQSVGCFVVMCPHCVEEQNTIHAR